MRFSENVSCSARSNRDRPGLKKDMEMDIHQDPPGGAGPVASGSYVRQVALILFSCLPSSLKLAVYRSFGARIGKGTRIGIGSYIIPSQGAFDTIRIGEHVTIGKGVQILAKKTVLGEWSQIRDNTRIWGEAEFSLGKEGYIDRDCRFDLRRDIRLGDGVVVSGGTWFFTHMVYRSVMAGAPYRFGPITVGERCYIGANAFFYPGSRSLPMSWSEHAPL